MNYCLYFAMRVEDEWLKLMDDMYVQRGISREELTVDEELQLYETAKNAILEQDGGKTQAAGDCRLGELILIIDSDTRVPEDCLLYGALEMEESPEVSILPCFELAYVDTFFRLLSFSTPLVSCK